MAHPPLRTQRAVLSLWLLPDDMMLETFGDAYRQYRHAVPMLVPRPPQATG